MVTEFVLYFSRVSAPGSCNLCTFTAKNVMLSCLRRNSLFLSSGDTVSEHLFVYITDKSSNVFKFLTCTSMLKKTLAVGKRTECKLPRIAPEFYSDLL